jgi:hypothetical protein
MLSGQIILDKVVDALKSIQDVVTTMAGDPTRIYADHMIYGKDNPRKVEEYAMLRPGIHASYGGPMGGNYDGETMWKHNVELVCRMQNYASQVNVVTYAHLFWYICNGPILGTTVNIRNKCLLPNLNIPDNPSYGMETGEDGADFMKVHFVFPEIGDWSPKG